MKHLLLASFIALSLVCLTSCEKDDICVDGDTPLLVIGFFDINDTTETKTVPSLRIKEVLLDSVVNTITDRSGSLDSIGLPLRINTESTQFIFIANSGDNTTTGEETGTIDTLTVAYKTREVFISRACGFVVQYTQVTATTNTSNWIQDIKVVQPTVENSNAIHVKIFH